MPKEIENKKNLNKTHPRTPQGIKSDFIPKKGVRDYLVSVSSPRFTYTVSTQRVEPTTSKAMISARVPVLAVTSRNIP